MPELPEVETIRRELEREVVGRRLVRCVYLRRDMLVGERQDGGRSLAGRTIVAVQRQGKVLLMLLSAPARSPGPARADHRLTASGLRLLLHLGMTGQIGLAVSPPQDKHVVLALLLDDGWYLYMRDPRRFGAVEIAPPTTVPRLTAKQGIDALDPKLTVQRLGELLAGRRLPLKSFLIDQRRLAGLGNIYASEILFVARLHPLRPAGTLRQEEVARLHRAMREVLRAAIKYGGTTIADYRRSSGRPGGFQKRLQVYGRAEQPCLRPGCPGTIRRLVVGGRSTYMCPCCQEEAGPGAG
jgi:formamidopyrimidine-DNA glycosylase